MFSLSLSLRLPRHSLFKMPSKAIASCSFGRSDPFLLDFFHNLPTWWLTVQCASEIAVYYINFMCSAAAIHSYLESLSSKQSDLCPTHVYVVLRKPFFFCIDRLTFCVCQNVVSLVRLEFKNCIESKELKTKMKLFFEPQLPNNPNYYCSWMGLLELYRFKF